MFIFCDYCLIVTKHRFETTVYTGKETPIQSECCICGSLFDYEYNYFQELLQSRKELIKEMKKI